MIVPFECLWLCCYGDVSFADVRIEFVHESAEMFNS